MRSITNRMSLLLGLAIFAVTGCGQDTTDQSGVMTKPTASDLDGSKYMLDAEPDTAKSVLEARADATDGEDIVVVGRIGGSENPWIDGRAAFSIVDEVAKPCNEIPGDKCPKPWDYCCEDNLASKTTLVKFVGDDGKALSAGAKDLFKVKELDTVIIKGKAKRDDAGNLTVLASSMFVRK